MKKIVGIVLRSLSFDRDRLSVFERHEGKKNRFFSNKLISPGTLVTYFVDERSNKIFSEQVLDIPFELARSDIFFLHHVLELCYYFLPSHDPARPTFNLLMQLYYPKPVLEFSKNKKIFLFKLLVSFGCYADYAPLSVVTFNWLYSESIDTLANANIHLEIERKLDDWLCLCISSHQNIKNFKTVHFLKKIRRYE